MSISRYCLPSAFYIYLKRQYSTDGLVKDTFHPLPILIKRAWKKYSNDGLNHCYGKLSDEALKSLDISKASPLFRNKLFERTKMNLVFVGLIVALAFAGVLYITCENIVSANHSCFHTGVFLFLH